MMPSGDRCGRITRTPPRSSSIQDIAALYGPGGRDEGC
jgi:hypothetical protein